MATVDLDIREGTLDHTPYAHLSASDKAALIGSVKLHFGIARFSAKGDFYGSNGGKAGYTGMRYGYFAPTGARVEDSTMIEVVDCTPDSGDVVLAVVHLANKLGKA
jgi:hypothetical protein